ncbi:MAG: DUF4230 domain-containing protein [Bacillota bacterium]|nr:DUF4230 domain-containing protein [Bacillota bacterium]
MKWKYVLNGSMGTLAILIVLSLIVFFYTRDYENPVKVEIKEELIPVETLVTNEYHFTELLEFSDSNDWIVFDSLSENKYIASVEGMVYTETDLRNMKCKTTILGNKMKKVVFTIPHSRASNVYIDHSSITVLEQRNGLFNPIYPEDTNKLLEELEKNKVKKIEENGLLEQADQEAIDILERHVHDTFGNDVEVVVKFS